MQIVNETWIPTHQLEELIEFAKPIGREPNLITFLCARDTHGRAHKHFRDGVFRDAHVEIFVGPNPHLPTPGFTWTWTAGRLLLHGLEEVLIFVVAHELQHVAQRIAGGPEWLRRRERNADAWAVRALRRWRREHPLSCARPQGSSAPPHRLASPA